MSLAIQVDVDTEYLDDQSRPDQNKYTFAYHITITNTGAITATLRSRHWIITDGEGERKEVTGEGVIGEQPTIKPGESYQYSSFAVLDTTVGTMEGSYRMEAENGEFFKAPINPFLLAVPGTIN